MISEEQKLKGTLSGGQSLAGSMKDIPSVDKTLTKEGYAADSKAVGDALATKANESHQHKKKDITDFPTSLPASDVYDWAKQPQKPSYTASEVKARPDTWMPTPEQIGAAPAGYGLGGNANTMSAIPDANTATTNGWYHVNTGTANTPGVNGIMRVDAYGDGSLVQKIFCTSWSAEYHAMFQRVCLNGAWPDEWDWVDPPMKLGVEYRTTKRLNSKPVYERLNSTTGRLQYITPDTNVWSDYAPLMGAAETVRHIKYITAGGTEYFDLPVPDQYANYLCVIRPVNPSWTVLCLICGHYSGYYMILPIVSTSSLDISIGDGNTLVVTNKLNYTLSFMVQLIKF